MIRIYSDFRSFTFGRIYDYKTYFVIDTDVNRIFSLKPFSWKYKGFDYPNI